MKKNSVLNISIYSFCRKSNVFLTFVAINAVKSDDPTALINLICVNLDNYARAYDDRAVKKTLTILAWLNTACDNCGINYSKVLKDALIAKLQQVQM